MNRPIQSTPGAPAVVADRLALVYDGSGRILHHHRVTTLQGARTRTDQEVAEAALSHARQRRGGELPAAASVLLVTPDQLTAGHLHRVDVAARVLITKPIPVPPLRPRPS